MSDSSHAGSGGMSLAGVLTTIFVVLKLVGVISWPWIWVFSPIWIALLLVVAILLIVLIIGILAGL